MGWTTTQINCYAGRAFNQEKVMSSRGPYRRHAPEFKIQLWLTQFDQDEVSTEEAEATVIAEYEAQITALERKVGQLTMELGLVKKSHGCAS